MGLQVGIRRRISDYELVRLVGSGAVSEVYEALRHGPRGFSRRVALKRILPQHRNDPRLVEMFVAEARVSASLSHPNLVQVLDFGEHGGEIFLVMEFVEGLTCRELLSAVSVRHRRVELGPALHVAREVLRGLEFLHTHRDEVGREPHLVHRDVVPSNVLLGRSGQVKLADYGIVRGDSLPSCTQPGEIRGKVGYISPEQSRGEPVDARSDLFSVGVVLAELLIGCRLFGGETELEILGRVICGDLTVLSERGAGLPPRLLALIEALLAPRAADRPRSATVVTTEIGAIAEAEGADLTDHALGEYLAELGLVALTSEVRDRRVGARAVDRLELPDSRFVGRVLATREESSRASTLPPPQARLVGSEAPATRPEPNNVIALDRRATTRPPPAAVLVEYRLREAGPHAQPLPLAKLLGMLATGRLSYSTEVSRNGGRFLPVGSFVELARLASRAPYRFGEPLEVRASESLSVAPGLVARRLFALVRDCRTGLFCAQAGGRQTRVYLVRGMPVFSASTDASSLFGECLMRRARLGRDVVESALELGWRRGERLGEALTRAGLVHPNHVVAALVEQRRERLVSLMQWATGNAFFVDGLECGESDPCPPVAALPLLTEAVLGAFTLRDLTRLLARVRDCYLARSPVADRLTLALGLPLASARALSRAHFAPNLDMLVQILAHERVADPLETMRGVFVGLAVGALCSEGWSSP